MNNIWFLRTDRDLRDESFDVSEKHQFIYSDHGSCGNQKDQIIQNYKHNIFPKLQVNKKDLKEFINKAKNHFINNGHMDKNSSGKEQCDFFIICWIHIMEIGDIVFVRNKKQEVLICKIVGYIEEDFFNKNGSFQRPIKILKKINSNIKELETIMHRTSGRKTLERNKNKDVEKVVFNYLEKNNLLVPQL